MMISKPVYLKPNVIVEPLFNQWYAWSYLIPPATASLYVANSHLKILESFIAAPQVHLDALKNPAMRGGPFINYDESRLDEIKTLWEKTKDNLALLLQLERAIKDLENLLKEEATGYSLEPLYQKVPEALKGYVELVYDVQNNPSIRLIEGLLYKSQYYNSALQTVALSLGNIDQRSFVLSTPRLPDDNTLHLNLSFADKRLDKLVQMREKPQAYQDILELLEIQPQNEPLFASLLTETPPPSQSKYQENDVRVRYFGHACILIETKDISILCDPLISYQFSDQSLDGIPRYSYADLPPTIDYALITHNHQDHVMFETLLQLRYKIKNVIVPKSNKGVLIDPSLKLILQQIGFANVREVDELEVIDIPEGEIVSLPVLGEHGDLNIAAKTAYLIQVKNRSILCAADSNNIEPQLYKHLSNLVKRLDILFVGMECEGAPFTWAYGSLLTQSIPRKIAQTRRLDGSDSYKAIKLINQLNPQQVYIYAMGQEPWLTFITSIQYTPDSKPILESNRVIEYCQSQNIIGKRLFGSQEIILESSSETAINVNFSVSHPEPKPSLNQPENYQPISEFLSQLNQLDIKIFAENDRIRCNAPKGALTSDIKAQLKERKPEIIQYLNSQNQQKITLDYLKAEATLDESIFPQTQVISWNQPHNILLTGATGFLGSFLLNQLLLKTEANIYCLVRGEQPETIENRLKNVLKSASLWDDSFKARIIPIQGDLSKPLLGLSSEKFQQLADEIDVIYHNGAWVHHASPYSLLKSTNVLGTQEILRFACQSHPKPVHFISTVSVFNFNEFSQVKVIREQDDLESGEVPNGGYAQSKWVAEKLVKIAAQRGLPTYIYRVGPISGSSQTGFFNTNDFLYRLMLGYIELGSAPQGEMLLDIIPVDYVSEAIVHLSQKPELIGGAFHLIHPQPVSSNLLFEQLGLMGYSIQRIPYERWYSRLLEIAKGSPGHALYPLVSLFSSTSSQKAKEKSMNLKFDCKNTIEGLAETSITCPPIDANLLKTYISQLIQKANFQQA